MAKKNELTHLAIILDGNGRWAEKHGVPRVKGHEAGAERVMQIVKDLKDLFLLRNVKLVKWFQNVAVAVLFNGLHNTLKIINNLKLKETYDL